MSVDHYQPCPCGGGKKIKFCCCKDIATDLDKIIRALEGEQRAAALDKIERLIASNGERAALLALKGEVQIQLGNLDDAKVTSDRFLEANPANPVALALSSVLESDNSAAIVKFQRAMESVDGEIPYPVYDALSVLAQSLVSSGDILAAKRHLTVLAFWNGDTNQSAFETLMKMHGSAQVPLLLKEDFVLAESPTGAAWSDAFDEAVGLANRGRWLAAAERLESLDKDAPGEPAILKNIAIFRSWMGDNAATSAAWHRYAEAETESLDRAVEAEALAQLLDPNAKSETIDVVTITYPVNDYERLKERLISDRRANEMPVEMSEIAGDDESPPNAAYWLLDRPIPASGMELSRTEVPYVLGELYLFGKQTDREARLDFSVSRAHDFDSKIATLVEVVGEFAGDSIAEETTSDIPATSAALTWNWRFPDDTPLELRSKLIGEQRTEVLVNKWPETPLPAIDGKTPNEVAADPAYKVKLLAAILLLELAGQHQDLPVMDFNDLRRKLELPARETIDPDDVDMQQVSLVQLAQLNFEKLSDDELVSAFQRAGATSALAALQPLALEVSKRESLREYTSSGQVHQILAGLTKDNDEAFQYIRTARELSVAQGNSPAQLLLTELRMRLERRVPDECNAIIEELRNRHFNESGVPEGLYNLLVSFGVIDPEGTPAGPPPADEPPAVEAGEPSTSGKALWTPDSEQQPSGQEKSKLWVPGMD